MLKMDITVSYVCTYCWRETESILFWIPQNIETNRTNHRLSLPTQPRKRKFKFCSRCQQVTLWLLNEE